MKNKLFLLIVIFCCPLALAHKANYFPAELFELIKKDITHQMERAYAEKTSFEEIASLQKELISEAAKACGLPDYDSISLIVSTQIQCSWEEELQPKSIRIVACLDATCENCSEPRAKFYEYLKTKVWMSEWGIWSGRRFSQK